MAAVAETLGALGGAVRAAEAEAGRLAQAREQGRAGPRRRAVRARRARGAPGGRRGRAGRAGALAGRAGPARRRRERGPRRGRSRPGWPSARRRSGPGRWPAAPTGWSAPPGPSGPPASGWPCCRAAGPRARPWRSRSSRGAQRALGALETSLAAAATERDAAAADRAGTDVALAALRGRTADLATELARLTDTAHRDEVARTEQRLRAEAHEARALQDWGVPVERLLAEYGPDVPVPAADEQGEPAAYDRAEQQARAEAADRALARLGKVNPLALEEFAALEERSAFLTTQLEDLHATRRDLLTVVGDVDARIHDVFAQAFDDTAREFVHVFATLFPGGEGRLVLTEPDDLLTTGIEVLARPAGKKVSRLSLLSGGERSLTAIALLVAIFRARPSPFYVMDEVEAALDDRNLGRLVELLNGLRESSQLIVITHQKRTMEIADALYGVTMRGDGVSTVVSQRLRERQPA